MHQNGPSLLLNNHKSNNIPSKPTKKEMTWIINITEIGKGCTAYAQFPMNTTEMIVKCKEMKPKHQLNFHVYF